jgi:hypothetical protein
VAGTAHGDLSLALKQPSPVRNPSRFRACCRCTRKSLECRDSQPGCVLGRRHLSARAGVAGCMSIDGTGTPSSCIGGMPSRQDGSMSAGETGGRSGPGRVRRVQAGGRQSAARAASSKIRYRTFCRCDSVKEKRRLKRLCPRTGRWMMMPMRLSHFEVGAIGNMRQW